MNIDSYDAECLMSRHLIWQIGAFRGLSEAYYRTKYCHNSPAFHLARPELLIPREIGHSRRVPLSLESFDVCRGTDWGKSDIAPLGQRTDEARVLIKALGSTFSALQEK